MGHSEMLLAVAGLKDDMIKQRVNQLASGDWSDFPPAERQAFRFADKLTRRPADLAKKDFDDLVATFGRHRTLDLIYRASWCNYMTRVADAFQLPLERENVFAPPRREKNEKTEKR